MLPQFAHADIDGSARIKDLKHLIDSQSAITEIDKLKIVNDFFNQRMKFIDTNYDLTTPTAFLAKGHGGSKDHTISKYLTLRALGVPEKKIRINYVKAKNKPHMVLTYFEKPTAIPLVLDNIVSDIMPANQRSDLLPIYATNGEALLKTIRVNGS